MSATAAGWLTNNLVNWANAMVSGDPNGDVGLIAIYTTEPILYRIPNIGNNT